MGFNAVTQLAQQAPSWAALGQVLMIDVVLAGDNALAVGLAASGLPASQRRQVIASGLAAAVAFRIVFALIASWLLGLAGLLLAGGLLLLWVCWKMWCDLRVGDDAIAHGEASPAKTSAAAFMQVLIADLSMSLDNILAVAGAAREHPMVLAVGLILSVLLMGMAANLVADLLRRHRWIGYAGLAVVLCVAGRMVWQGHRDLVAHLGGTAAYNRLAPSALAITPTRP